MNEQRKNVRFQTLAKASIKEANEGEILLKDISVLGCRVECTTRAGIELKKHYKLEVIPESVSKVLSFDLLVETMWIRTGNYACEIGFAIVESPKGKSFQRYVDYLSWRFSLGDSMGGNPENP